MKIICDLDGTLADSSERSKFVSGKHKNFKKFYEGIPNDTVIPRMKILLASLSCCSSGIVFCTGREGTKENEKMTWDWLDENMKFLKDSGVPVSLLMRKEKDYRPDSVVKIELLKDNGITPQNVMVIFDDRSRVVKALREEGYYVHQVAEGDF